MQENFKHVKYLLEIVIEETISLESDLSFKRITKEAILNYNHSISEFYEETMFFIKDLIKNYWKEKEIEEKEQ